MVVHRMTTVLGWAFAIGLVFLLYSWLFWIGVAQNMSVLPANEGFARYLASIVALQLVVLGGFLITAAVRARRRNEFIRWTPLLIWSLVLVNLARCGTMTWY